MTTSGDYQNIRVGDWKPFNLSAGTVDGVLIPAQTIDMHTIWGTPGMSSGCCQQYPLFYSSAKKLVKHNGRGSGQVVGWWLCTVHGNASMHVTNVSPGGHVSRYLASEKLSVPICFRVGGAP